MTVVVEQSLDFARHRRHDRTVKQRVQTGEEQSADDHGDQDFNAGIDVTLGLLVGDKGFGGNDGGVSLVTDLTEKLLH